MGCALVGVAVLSGVPTRAVGTWTGGKVGRAVGGGGAETGAVDPGRGTDLGSTVDPDFGFVEPDLRTCEPGRGVPLASAERGVVVPPVRGVGASVGRNVGPVADVGIET